MAWYIWGMYLITWHYISLSSIRNKNIILIIKSKYFNRRKYSNINVSLCWQGKYKWYSPWPKFLETRLPTYRHVQAVSFMIVQDSNSHSHIFVCIRKYTVHSYMKKKVEINGDHQQFHQSQHHKQLPPTSKHRKWKQSVCYVIFHLVPKTLVLNISLNLNITFIHTQFYFLSFRHKPS
jgi:hypothetical protein